MCDDAKEKPAAATQGGSADSAVRNEGGAPAHEAANPDTVTDAPPAAQGGQMRTTDDKPKESSPEKDDTPVTPAKAADDSDKKSSADDTVATAAADDDQDDPKASGGGGSKPVAIVASSKKARPPYKYDPDKITLRFLFANRDGLTVTVECNPGDTVGEVKGALLSVWPEDLPDCGGGESIRLVCMGKGFLMPDTRTLEDCQIPIFKTHPTPINVSIKPNPGKGTSSESTSKPGGASSSDAASNTGANPGTQQASQGCACIIL